MATKISWVINPDGSKGETINPIVGCSKISSGCKNCYAERMARRLANMGLQQYKEVTDTGYRKGHTPFGGWNSQVCFVRSELEKPYTWKKPRTIFVGSMGDVFYESVPLAWIAGIFTMIFDNPRHTFILLTKRPDRMLEMCTVWSHLKNLVVGVSVENQATADERIPWLLRIPAAKRFISLEPMLGPVDLSEFFEKPDNGEPYPEIHQVVLGGESGPKARPLNPDWVRIIRDQCEATGVPFFFKQWSATNPGPMCRIDDRYPLLVDDEAAEVPYGRTHTDLAWEVRHAL